MDNNGKLKKEDEAAEKLVEDGDANLKVEIQLVGGESQNGETKISMTEIKAAFIGMGKEELMKFANDPFWVKLRWFLFVLFWLLWFGMLFGAVAIILLAPKCTSPEPRNWYENSPIYYLSASDIQNDGDSEQDGAENLEGLVRKLDNFKDLGISTLLIDPLMTSTMGDPERIEDFKQVDPRYGTANSIKKVLADLKEKGFHVLMRFVPNYSSSNHSWFQKSIQRIPPYTDYYIWSNRKNGKDPPNNWLSVNGGSAWTWNDERKQYYLHQFAEDQPDLNFWNQEIVDYFSDVFKWWLDLGLSGVHVAKVDFLLENLNFTDEVISNIPGPIHDQYDFYRHTHTRDLPEVIGIIKQWTDIVRNASGVFSVSGIPDTEKFDSANLIHRPFMVKNDSVTAENLESYVNHTLKMGHQTWTVDNVGNTHQNPGITECLTDLMMLLPGTLVISNSTELGLETRSTPSEHANNNNETADLSKTDVEQERTQADSYYHTFKTLVKARSFPSIMHGTTETAIVNSTVFAFTRLKSGNPGFLVAFNTETKERVAVNLSHLKYVPEELTVIARSKNLWKQLPLKTSVTSSSLQMTPTSCVVLQFVPLSAEA